MKFRITYDKRKNLVLELSVPADEFDKIIDAIRTGEYEVEREVTTWEQYA